MKAFIVVVINLKFCSLKEKNKGKQQKVFPTILYFRVCCFRFLDASEALFFYILFSRYSHTEYLIPVAQATDPYVMIERTIIVYVHLRLYGLQPYEFPASLLHII